MTIREDLLSVLDDVRSVMGPDVMGHRQTRVSVLSRSWTEGRIAAGDHIDTTIVTLNQYYPIREVTMREVSQSGGRYRTGDLVVYRITPSDGNGVGYTPKQLAPNGSTGTEIIYVLTGEDAGEYALVDLERHRNYEYRLILTRRHSGEQG